MSSRRNFIQTTSALAIGSVVLPSFIMPSEKITNAGVQLYTFRDELEKDVPGTLKKIAALGIKQIESASSGKGHYYGLTAKDMKKACADLGMTLRSGHVGINDKWEQTIDEAAASGQEYLICSSMPSEGQTIDNYKKVAEIFNKAGEACKKRNIKFGYHNHGYEFDSADGKVLYDVLLENTNPEFVCMELDLGWVVVAGKNPLDYFKNHKGRFPLWHLKDMSIAKKHSTEFGKGDLDIPAMFKNREASGLKYFFIEQEEYSNNAFESMKENMNFLSKLSV